MIKKILKILMPLLVFTMSFASNITDFKITEIRGDRFAVSWVSTEPVQSRLKLTSPTEVNGRIYNDFRVKVNSNIADKRFRVHYIEVNGLELDTNYTFNLEIISTNGTVMETSANIQAKTADIDPRMSQYGPDLLGEIYDVDGFTLITPTNGDDPYYEAKKVANVYYEMFIENSAGQQVSAIRSGITGYKQSDDKWYHFWSAKELPFINLSLDDEYTPVNGDSLVVSFLNYSRGYPDGTWNDAYGPKRVSELRVPLNPNPLVSRIDVTIFEKSIPIIDDFNNNPTLLGWEATQNAAISLVDNGFGGKALQASATNADSDGYNGYIMYDFSTSYDKPVYNTSNGTTVSSNIKTNEGFDWGRYNYIKFDVMNIGVGAVDLKLDIKDNDTDNFAFVKNNDDEWVATLNLLKNDSQWRTIYVPLRESLLQKGESVGDGTFDLLQRFQRHEDYTDIYAGVPMIGFAISSGKPGGSATLIIDNIELVTNMGGVDSGHFGILDSELASYAISTTNFNPIADSNSNRINDYNEILNGYNPSVTRDDFPVLENFEGNLDWAIDVGTVASIVNTTDTTLSWNYDNSLQITGTAFGYYVGGLQKDISDLSANWDDTDPTANFAYNSLKLVLKATSINYGDRIKVKLEKDNNFWTFEQYLTEKNSWLYYSMLLEKFVSTDGTNLATVGNYSELKTLRIELVSSESSGSMNIYIDNINISTTDTTIVSENYDTDGDGLPNWYEEMHGLEINTANVDANGVYTNTDGDDWNDLEEFIAKTNPTQWTPSYPLIDNFDQVGYEWVPTQGTTITVNNQEFRNYLKLTGTASDYYSGFVGAYIANPLNIPQDTYNSLKVELSNLNGKVGDRLEVMLQDTTGREYSFHQVLVTSDWTWYTFLLNSFELVSGNGNLDLDNLSYIGFAAISASDNGTVEFKINHIELSTANTSLDTDGDGLPDTWEVQYGLDAYLPNINASGDLRDSDGDGITDLQHYLASTAPNKGFIRDIDYGWNSLSYVSGNTQPISEILTYLNSELGVGSISRAAIYKNGSFEYSIVTDFTVSYADTYYIYSNVQATINLNTVGVIMPYEYTFSTGWNNLGKSLGSSYTASELLAEINSQNIKADTIRLLENDRWQVYNIDIQGPDFTIGVSNRSKGFQIYFRSNFTWKPNKE
jgi:hypothetical protein